MKNQNKLKIFLSTILFIAFSTSIFAQNYGGSAYVYVKDDDGKARCITVVIECNSGQADKAKARYYLENQIQSKMDYGETKTSSISFDINSCSDSTEERYSGRASVEVSDKNGATRIIKGSEQCSSANPTKSKTKYYLLQGLLSASNYGEYFIEPVKFNIERCN